MGGEPLLPQVQCALRVARALNDRGAVWAMGASMLLYFHGLLQTPRDVDILAAPRDIALVDAVMRDMGQARDAAPNAAYATAHFCEYAVDGIEVDVIAGFVVCREGKRYAYDLRPEEFTHMTVAGIDMPLTPLEDWYILYQLMPDRERRVAELYAYLAAHGARKDVLAKWHGMALPASVRQSLDALPIV